MQVGTIVAVEHSPVYTLGRREKEDKAVTDALKGIGAEVIKVWLQWWRIQTLLVYELTDNDDSIMFMCF